MKSILGFGEKVAGYDVPVLNEREIRAAAGILFLCSFFSFMHVWLIGNYFYVKLFVSGFLLDFIIRMLINPRYAPSLIIGRRIVRSQEVEYTGAPQKRFAWTIGLGISLYLFVSLVLLNNASIVSCILCIVCLIFLFCETAFGICIGCLLYNLTHAKKAHFCPGGVCEIHQRQPIQEITPAQVAVVGLFVLAVWGWSKTPWLKLQQSAVTGYECALKAMFGSNAKTGRSCAPVAR